ncbi:MAG: M50 family metallopeptidase [Candidatus Kapaibacterium sp.]
MMPEKNLTSLTPRRINLLWLIGFAILTIVLWNVPGGKTTLYPFTLLGTWFHEMSHGVAAMILGGNFHRLELFADGSGLAYFSGRLFLGNIGHALVAMAGPLGPTIAGSVLIILSVKRKAVSPALIIFSFILGISALIWIRSIVGLAVALGFALILMYAAIKGSDRAKMLTAQFLGIQAWMSVYLSFDYLFSSGASVGGGSYKSDTAVIAEYLLLPHWFWGGLIILISLFLLYQSLRFAYFKRKS